MKKKIGGYQGRSNVIEILFGLIGREGFGWISERVFELEKIADCAVVFVTIESPENGLPIRALSFGVGYL